ncbi:MAG TPA: flagellar basal body P-ring formation chaperone FlgA [Gemmatimonadaceae bacterium]|nr:flagellar basal body P-ring formation chaperone FlgA [Gemmatimonadaceae bacterium]
MPRHSVLVALVGTAAALAPVGAQETAPQRLAVAARALPRGWVLGDGDIEWISALDAAGRIRVIASGAEVTPGWITRRVMKAGEPLRTPAVVPPPLVRADEPVEVVVRRGDVQLSVRGRVSRDAGVGERVAVRLDAGRRFECIVEAPGRVRLP